MSLLTAVRLKASRQVLVRRQAVTALGESGGWLAVTALRASLDDADYGVRYSAADALGRLRDRRAVGALVKALGGSDGELLQRALAALGRIADPRTFDVLAEALAPRSPYRVVPNEIALPSIADGLARIGDGRAAPLLVPFLTHDRAGVRRGVLEALRTLGWTPATRREEAAALVAEGAWERAAGCGVEAIEPLLVALRDAKGGVQREAATAFGRVGPAAIAKLLPLLAAYDPSVRTAASDALAAVGAAAVDPLLELAKEEKARPLAFETLKTMGVRAVPWLTKRLAHPDAATRRRAADALGIMQDPRAAGALIAALTDASAGVRSSAAAALEKLGKQPGPGDEAALLFAVAAQRWDDVAATGERAVDALVARIADDAVRWNVIRTLGKIGGARAADAVAAVVEGTGDYDRREAIEALIGLRDPRALPPLEYTVRNPGPYQWEWHSRLEAVKALQRFGGPGPMPALSHALGDRRREVRRAAADALDVLGWQAANPEDSARRLVARAEWAAVVALGAPASPALRPAIEDDDFATAFAAAQSLAAIGEAYEIPAPLLKGLEQADQQTRLRAIDAIAKARDVRVPAVLAALLADKSRYVAGYAAEVLVRLGPPALEGLIAALSSASRHAGELAAGVLGTIGDARAVPALIAGLSGPTAAHAARALARLGDRRAVEPLIAALASKGDVAAAAAYALGCLGDPRAIPPLLAQLPAHASYRRDEINPIVHAVSTLSPGDVDTVLAALDQPAAPVWALALALGECRELRAVDRLIASLPGSPDPDADAIAAGLAKIGDRRALPALAERLDESGRATFARALVTLGDARGLEPLMRYARRVSGSRYDEYNGVPSGVPEAVNALTTLLEASAADASTESLDSATRFGDLCEVVWHMINGCTRGEYSRGISCALVRQLARQELIRRGTPAGESAKA